MVRLHGRRRYVRGGHVAQEGLSPLGGEFADGASLVNLLANIPQELDVFVIEFTIAVASALGLEQMVTFFPHAQEFGTHSQHARHGLDTVACHALTSRAGSIGGVGSLSRVGLVCLNIASTLHTLSRRERTE